jgi:hypothetical protein
LLPELLSYLVLAGCAVPLLSSPMLAVCLWGRLERTLARSKGRGGAGVRVVLVALVVAACAWWLAPNALM